MKASDRTWQSRARRLVSVPSRGSGLERGFELFAQKVNEGVSVPSRGSGLERQTQSESTRMHSWQFQSPRGEAVLKGRFLRGNVTQTFSSVSVPSRGSGLERFGFVFQIVRWVYLFQSPRGEAVLKAAAQGGVSIPVVGFQSPRGEAVLKGS